MWDLDFQNYVCNFSIHMNKVIFLDLKKSEYFSLIGTPIFVLQLILLNTCSRALILEFK